jgi:hypothetical protein
MLYVTLCYTSHYVQMRAASGIIVVPLDTPIGYADLLGSGHMSYVSCAVVVLVT